MWFHEDIGFSRAGSLTNALVDLTTRSAAGMTAEQLGAKLRCRCRSILVQLCRKGRLHALARAMREHLVEQGSRCGTLARSIKDALPLEDNALMAEAAVYSLTLWALQGKHSGDGYGFPFDRPLLPFAQRLLELDSHLPELLDLFLTDEESHHNQAIWKLALEVSYVGEDSHLRSAVHDRLRNAMRIAPVDGSNGLNDEGTPETISTIRHRVSQFSSELKTNPKLAKDPLAKKMAEQIDKYDELFADPISVNTPNGPIVIYPQRTNNILERFFRGQRHEHRRKKGNDSMSRTLQAMLAVTPLVKNLDNPGCMKILLDGKENLEHLFAELGAENGSGPDRFLADTHPILPGFRELMRLPALPDRLIRSLGKMTLSN